MQTLGIKKISAFTLMEILIVIIIISILMYGLTRLSMGSISDTRRQLTIDQYIDRYNTYVLTNIGRTNTTTNTLNNITSSTGRNPDISITLNNGNICNLGSSNISDIDIGDKRYQIYINPQNCRMTLSGVVKS